VGTRSPRPSTRSSFNAYYKRYKDNPRLGSVVGYSAMQADLRRYREGRIDRYREADRRPARPAVRHSVRPVTMRALDHQSTMGAYVGKLDLRGGVGH